MEERPPVEPAAEPEAEPKPISELLDDVQTALRAGARDAKAQLAKRLGMETAQLSKILNRRNRTVPRVRAGMIAYLAERQADVQGKAAEAPVPAAAASPAGRDFPRPSALRCARIQGQMVRVQQAGSGLR
jgi:hypothetical protein